MRQRKYFTILMTDVIVGMKLELFRVEQYERSLDINIT